ncbi:MAG: glycosyltransferase [Planctomycetes bacterium]|nr:glycosyltransferase [Planctomycetota bacterium]
MKIGIFQHGWWREAIAVGGHDPIELPMPDVTAAGPYVADLSTRRENGSAMHAVLTEQPVDVMLDNGGVGLAFLPGTQGPNDLRLVHEAAGVRLFSHFIDPVTTVMQGLDWPTVWQALKSRMWVKAVWDRAQVRELQRFGVPSVIHLPMAAPDREYDSDPVDPDTCRPIVSFVGGQNTSFYLRGRSIDPETLLPATMAHAVRADMPGMDFLEFYHDLYGLAALPKDGDNLETQVHKTQTYFCAKLAYNAALCIKNRDRFVIFLSRKLGPVFELIGRGWDTAYGLACAPQIATHDAYFDYLRHCAINLNLVNGNAETGLNMRHFEITAAGGFMLCRDQGELRECFDVGSECEVFGNEAELVEKIEYYLNHPSRRADIAAAGQRRTLGEHLYSHRLARVMNEVARQPVSVAV